MLKILINDLFSYSSTFPPFFSTHFFQMEIWGPRQSPWALLLRGVHPSHHLQRCRCGTMRDSNGGKFDGLGCDMKPCLFTHQLTLCPILMQVENYIRFALNERKLILEGPIFHFHYCGRMGILDVC